MNPADILAARRGRRTLIGLTAADDELAGLRR